MVEPRCHYAVYKNSIDGERWTWRVLDIRSNETFKGQFLEVLEFIASKLNDVDTCFIDRAGFDYAWHPKSRLVRIINELIVQEVNSA